MRGLIARRSWVVCAEREAHGPGAKQTAIPTNHAEETQGQVLALRQRWSWMLGNNSQQTRPEDGRDVTRQNGGVCTTAALCRRANVNRQSEKKLQLAVNAVLLYLWVNI